MSVITEFTQYVEDLAKAAGAIAGLTVAVVIASEKIARCIPTNWKNKTVRIIAKTLYYFFATLGLKAPDIAAVKDGKIVTNMEAIAQETIDKQPETTVTESK